MACVGAVGVGKAGVVRDGDSSSFRGIPWAKGR